MIIYFILGLNTIFVTATVFQIILFKRYLKGQKNFKLVYADLPKVLRSSFWYFGIMLTAIRLVIGFFAFLFFFKQNDGAFHFLIPEAGIFSIVNDALGRILSLEPFLSLIIFLLIFCYFVTFISIVAAYLVIINCFRSDLISHRVLE